MHLLLAQKGTLSDGDGEAVDLGQTPGDICFLSAADTELASLAGAYRGEAFSLRLVNLLQLKHPMSVDAWVERTGRHAKLIVVRILGGAGYWPYGLEAIHAAAVAHGIKLAVLPGDDKSDPGLARFCTLPAESCDALWRFLIEGGAENARGFLDGCGDILAGREIEAQAAPLLKAGIFALPPSAPDGASPPQGGRVASGTAAIVFYRALVQAGQTAPVEALAQALATRGLAVLPVYVSSLKDPVSAATVEALFDTHRPDVVLNMTGFAVSAPGADRTPTVLERGRRTGDPGGAVEFTAGGLGGFAAGAERARPRDERGAAGSRRAGAVARRVVQVGERLGHGDRVQCRDARAGRGPDRIRRRTGRAPGAAEAETRG